MKKSFLPLLSISLLVLAGCGSKAGAPGGLHGSSSAYGVALMWDIDNSNTSDMAVSFNMYRKTAGATTFSKINTEPIIATGFIDDIVTDGETYSYVVKSVDTAGHESAPSNTFTTVVP